MSGRPAVGPRLRSYDAVAGVYDAGSHLYSGGAIAASKRTLLGLLASGDRVCFLGVGTGAEAAAACGRGATVTAVDRSPKMLAALRRRLPAGAAADLHLADALDPAGPHARPGGYDVVAAHYFLNLFAPDVMPAALRRAADLVRPGGALVIADLAPVRGGAVGRAAQRAYAGAATAAFRAAGLCAWHAPYDYAAACRDAGLTVHRVVPHRVAGVGPAWFETTVARRPG